MNKLDRFNKFFTFVGWTSVISASFIMFGGFIYSTFYIAGLALKALGVLN